MERRARRRKEGDRCGRDHRDPDVQRGGKRRRARAEGVRRHARNRHRDPLRRRFDRWHRRRGAPCRADGRPAGARHPPRRARARARGSGGGRVPRRRAHDVRGDGRRPAAPSGEDPRARRAREPGRRRSRRRLALCGRRQRLGARRLGAAPRLAHVDRRHARDVPREAAPRDGSDDGLLRDRYDGDRPRRASAARLQDPARDHRAHPGARRRDPVRFRGSLRR